MMENPEYTKAVYFLNPFIEETRNELQQALEQVLNWEQEKGLIRKEMWIDLMATSILATMERTFLLYLSTGKDEIDVLAHELSNLYVYGSSPR